MTAESQDSTHAEVFGALHASPFTEIEAAEYLEVSLIRLREFVARGDLAPDTQTPAPAFSTSTLKSFKKYMPSPI
jgi:hypothetical protein